MAVQRQFWELLVWRSNQVLRSDFKLFVNAQVLDPDLLVPDPDPEKYADSRIRNQGANYSPKHAKEIIVALETQISIIKE